MFLLEADPFSMSNENLLRSRFFRETALLLHFCFITGFHFSDWSLSSLRSVQRRGVKCVVWHSLDLSGGCGVVWRGAV